MYLEQWCQVDHHHSLGPKCAVSWVLDPKEHVRSRGLVQAVSEQSGIRDQGVRDCCQWYSRNVGLQKSRGARAQTATATSMIRIGLAPGYFVTLRANLPCSVEEDVGGGGC